MLKLIGGILALGGAGLLGVLALGGAGFDALGAAAGSPSTTIVLVCDRVGVDSATATVQLSNAGGAGPEVSLSCGPVDRRSRERVVDFNADFAVVTTFLVTRTVGGVPDTLDCAPISEPLTLTAVCPAGSPNASLKVQ